MSIYRQVIRCEWPRILDEISGHPVIFRGGGDVLHLLTKFTAKNFCSAFSRRSDETNRDARVVSHGDECGFSVTRKAFDANLLCVNGFVRFEIINRATRTPGPGSQNSPIIRLARLALIYEADDSLRKAFTIVGLNCSRDELSVAPASCHHLVLPAWASAYKRSQLLGRHAFADHFHDFRTDGEFHNHRHRTMGISR